MLGITSQQWANLLSNPLAIALLVYLLIGFVIEGIIAVSGMKLRRPAARRTAVGEKRSRSKRAVSLSERSPLAASYFSSLHCILAVRASLALGQPR